MSFVEEKKHPNSDNVMRLEVTSSDEQTIALCRDYWLLNDADGEFLLTLKQIAENHAVKSTIISTLVGKNSSITFSNIKCADCGIEYQLFSRSQFKGRFSLENTICSACKSLRKEAVLNEQRGLYEAVKQDYYSARCPELSELDLKTTIYLIAAIGSIGEEGLTTISSLESYKPCSLSPHVEYDSEILKHLIEARIAFPCFNPQAMEFRFEEGKFNYELENCKLETIYNKSELFGLHHGFLKSVPQPDELLQNHEFKSLCIEIQFRECLAFMEMQIREHNLNFSAGEKTRIVLTKALEKYSVAQVYAIIWRAVKDAAAYYMRGSVSKSQAANSVVSNISRTLDKNESNGWYGEGFKRNFKLPQSFLSILVFDQMLGVDDGGFNKALYALGRKPLNVIEGY